jgi:protein involved in polysaccharide export with SLBB domain
LQWINLRDIQAGKLWPTRRSVTATRSSCEGAAVFVTGYVRSLAHPLEPNLTVLQAISMAGGLTDRGSDRRVKIIRNKKQSDAKLTDTVRPTTRSSCGSV